jgi:isochorismate pyruvate lyase
MKIPHEYHSIEEVRQKIDEIDNSIIGLIGERFSIIQEIVKYKSSIDEVYATDRYNTVLRKRMEVAAGYGLDPDVIEKMYRIMMDYFIKEQLELLKKKQKQT